MWYADRINVDGHSVRDIDVKYLDALIYMIDSETSIRRASSRYSIGKSSLHTFIHKRLPSISSSFYDEVKRLLKINAEQRNNFERFPRPQGYHKKNGGTKF